MKFTAIAPDGTEITFKSTSRLYTHAVLTKINVAPADAKGYGETRPQHTGWKLYARVGSYDLGLKQLAQANKDTFRSYGEWLNNGKWFKTGEFRHRELNIIVNVTHN